MACTGYSIKNTALKLQKAVSNKAQYDLEPHHDIEKLCPN